MANATGSSRFRVIIVGAGVAGLTLANALEQANVDYVLLERRGEVAPQVGASIGLFPNGARILDQLGVWKGVEERAEPLKVFYNRGVKGKVMGKPDRVPLLLRARTGYTLAWGERQNLLRVLYENLKDPSKVLVNKSLTDIKHDVNGVTAICEDGTTFSGDLLVGADGVFSKTRSKMWQFAEADHPQLVKEDKNCMTAEYNCLFGIVKGLDCPRFPAGDVHTAYDFGRCALSISVEGGKAYYFAQERLPRTHHLGDIPRYTDADAKAFVERHRDLIILPGEGGLTLHDLWEKTVSSRLVAIEEAKFKLWHWGRITCVGDSIHKSTPNLGVGGNSAIESAAALANGIKLLADKWNAAGRRPTQHDIEAMLTTYQNGRELRAGAVVDASGLLARSHNMHGLSSYLVRLLLPYMSEFVPELMGNAIIGATKIDYLPLPMASLTGFKPFNPSQGDGQRESKFKRMVFALPLLALFFIAGWVMNANPALEGARDLLDSGVLRLASGDVPILRSFYQIPALDDLVALYNTFFFPTLYDSDPTSRRQLISFLTDGTILVTIWIFESARRANMITPLQFPALYITLGQLFGIGLAAPLYTFIHYTLSPIENFSALDQRLTRTRVTYAALPAVLLAYLLPAYAMLSWPDLPTRQALLYVWQLYPAWLALALWAIGRVCFKDEMETDKVYRTQRDLPVMRWYVGGLGLVGVGLWEVFGPVGLPRDMGDFGGFTGQFLRWDEVFGLGSLLVWLAYLFWDLRAAGMLREGWLRVVGLGLVSVLVVGPGATIGMGWLFREHILATRRHKDALTPESVGSPVDCSELRGLAWQMFVSWLHHRDYVVRERGKKQLVMVPPISGMTRVPQSLHFLAADTNKPDGSLCLHCFGILTERRGIHDCERCGHRIAKLWICREPGCSQVDSPVSRTPGVLSRKVRSFVRLFSHLGRSPWQLGPPASPILPEKARPWCHARRLDVQFQLYYFAEANGLTELRQFVLCKVWHTLMHLQLHPRTFRWLRASYP
ncbi:hypothetical protein B0I37DRAFT_395815 [Chaetomium sp. MPI-CAGE-AT-0009]|nr:hypothetical protein B0I37DRAFT_395815 [Chaetomium sp. MPI-CAGE-AT-0009]